jgi:hypothetical protein
MHVHPMSNDPFRTDALIIGSLRQDCQCSGRQVQGCAIVILSEAKDPRLL